MPRYCVMSRCGSIPSVHHPSFVRNLVAVASHWQHCPETNMLGFNQRTKRKTVKKKLMENTAS